MNKTERFVDAYVNGVILIKNVEHVPDQEKGIYVPVVQDTSRIDTKDPLVMDALRSLGWVREDERHLDSEEKEYLKEILTVEMESQLAEFVDVIDGSLFAKEYELDNSQIEYLKSLEFAVYIDEPEEEEE